jgi:2-phosphosulfolactate phosphatase
MSDSQSSIEVCFSPALYPFFHQKKAVVVVTDILRASSAICTAFMHGVEKIIPVETIEEAKLYKNKGFLVAAERDGFVLDFADFGNSPFNFSPSVVKNKTIVYSTTNGTQAIHMANKSSEVIIGSFLNLTATCNWLINQQKNIVILCAGWKNKFNLEDTLFAGAIVEQLLLDKHFYTICDSANASLDLWNIAKHNLIHYIEKTAQRNRLRKNKLDDVIEFCLTPNITDILPVLRGDFLTRMENKV